STHLKLIAELYDKCQEVCTQYAEFLQHALGPVDYATLLPSMEDLATVYCIDPELIFSFYRPLIHSIEPPGAPPAPDDDEEGQIAEGGSKQVGTAVPPGAQSAGGGPGAGPEAMEEEGQLEAGEVAASPGEAAAGTAAAGGPAAAPEAAAEAAKRWEELEQQ
ncbi:hypothetical protein CHLNCDRAFT_144612, partial [Chlorella variabilis]